MEHNALRLTPDEWMLPLFGDPQPTRKRDVLWVVSRATGSGQASVYVDGVNSSPVDLRSSTTAYRQAMPGPDDGAQTPDGKRQSVLPDLTHSGLQVILAVLDTTTDGEPPSRPRTARITTA